jgi:hypothetical protein
MKEFEEDIITMTGARINWDKTHEIMSEGHWKKSFKFLGINMYRDKIWIETNEG